MADPGAGKAAGALRTIGEVTAETGVATHVLRYWESKFPRLKPVTRAGGRRYYRPEDVALIARIDALLRREGYTIRGVQKLLAAEGKDAAPPVEPVVDNRLLSRVRQVRDTLAAALADDAD